MSSRDFDRLVRLLDDHRPGDDPSALVALVPLARRRGEPGLLARLAACFVDQATSQLPEHGLTLPTSVEALVGKLDAHGHPPAPPWLVGESATAEAWSAAIDSGRCAAELTRAAVELMGAFVEKRPAQPPLAPVEAEAALMRLGLGHSMGDGFVDPVAPILIDRWVVLGGLETAVRTLATASRIECIGGFENGHDGYMSAVGWRADDEAAPLYEPGVQRLRRWFALSREALPARSELRRWLERASLDDDERDATIELWLADTDETEPVAALCERLATPLPTRRVRSAHARVRVLGALRPGQGDLLAALLQDLVRYNADLACDYLPVVAERLGAEALDALVAFREAAPHHKYVGLAGQAIARIPGRRMIRLAATDLGSKAKTRVEDARTACLFHPTDAMLELPLVIAGLAADTARKGKADRERAIERATAILTDDIAVLHPIATWILLPTVADEDLRQRIEKKIPAEFRRDPEAQDAAEPFEKVDWLAGWPTAAGARNPRLYDDDLVLASAATGELGREQIRRILLGLTQATSDERRERTAVLVEHTRPDTLETFACALLATWNKKLKQRFADLWLIGFATCVGGPNGRAAVRSAISTMHSKRREERFNAALRELEACDSRVHALEVLGILRHETTREELQSELDRELRRVLLSANQAIPLTAPLPFADEADLPGKKRSKTRQKAIEANGTLAEQLLRWWMVQGEPVTVGAIRGSWFDHAMFEPDLRDRVLWARVEGPDAGRDVVLEVDVNGLRDVTDETWVKPLHPALVEPEALEAAVTALRAAEREPLEWQIVRPVADDAPRMPTNVPAWALQVLRDRAGWVVAGDDVTPLGVHRLRGLLKSDVCDDAVTIELERSADPLSHWPRATLRPLSPTLSASRRAEALADLAWLVDVPATGEQLRRWREARGLDHAGLESYLGVRGASLWALEERELLSLTPALIAAFWAQRQRSS